MAIIVSRPGEAGPLALQYEVVEDWPRLPAGWSLVEVADVAVDGQDRVYLFNRGEHPMLVFDPQGNLLDTWGEGLFGRAHGVTVAPDDTLWCADDGNHTIRHCTAGGQVLSTLGMPGHPAPYQSGQPFNRPTKVAIDARSGDLFIADGYGNARVHRYTADGRHLLSWGEYGCGPGQFNLVHSVCTDPAGRVYVADRESHRVQVFDGEGRFLEQWLGLHRPCGLHISGGAAPLCYVGQLPPSLPVNQDYPNLGARVSIHDLQGRCLAWLGDERPGEGPGQFLAPHGIALDSHGDMYIAEVSWSFLGRTLHPPRQMRCFRKLVRAS